MNRTVNKTTLQKLNAPVKQLRKATAVMTSNKTTELQAQVTKLLHIS